MNPITYQFEYNRDGLQTLFVTVDLEFEEIGNSQETDDMEYSAYVEDVKCISYEGHDNHDEQVALEEHFIRPYFGEVDVISVVEHIKLEAIKEWNNQ